MKYFETRKEGVYFFLVLVIGICYIATLLIFQPQIKGYEKALNQCIQKINDFNNGYTDVYGRFYNVSMDYATLGRFENVTNNK